MSSVIPAPAGGEFDYLLRAPRHARRLRRIWITACIVAFVVIAAVLYACT